MALLVIAIVTVLYFAKAFFLPVVTAFVVGTMLSPAAGYLERRHIPRSVSAVLIVIAACAGVAFIVGLIASPLMEWSTRLPELGALLKEKMHMFDRPLALWQQLQGMLGGSETLPGAPFQMPKFEWVQPTFEFLSPTFAEFLLFAATLILFIASWRDLRRALIMTFADRDSRLRTLRILNEIEGSLGGYLLMVTADQSRRRGRDRDHLRGDRNAESRRARGAGGNPELLPHHRPGGHLCHSHRCRLMSFSTLSAGLMAPLAFVGLTFLEGHFVTPAIIGRRLELNALAVLIALAFWTWLWGPMGGFLSSPILIVGLILKEHLMPVDAPQLPPD